MRVALLLLSVVLAVSAAPNTHQQRIVGGELTSIDRYPFQAAILQSIDLVSYTQSCGGTILNQRSILSAAHCFMVTSPVNYRVRVGSTYANSGGVVHTVAQLINHPSYNAWTQDNDIAVVRLSSQITYNDYAQPGSISGPNYNLADNQVVWATGWGLTSHGGQPSEQLRHVQIWTINQEICRQRYSTVITDNMLCSGWLDVGGRDQCSQDSGGPLIHSGVVVGVCSFGNNCADPYYPGVNARVSRYTSWIQANA
ncbi:trypsin CFT-1-like [Leguminivora glycinivorella]|uniref:trypsin CFT-1-like n=1 Tax=Leguminivora glycinivorella TaxID=1035111 RepID=UPI00200DCF7E|nr:trypsin CFT-1-like [Leguminivora glycinivorella]